MAVASEQDLISIAITELTWLSRASLSGAAKVAETVADIRFRPLGLHTLSHVH
jgi:hypothetical protein